MLEVLKWFSGKDSETAGLPVVRMKNKFGSLREDVPDGYRDLKLFVAYTSPTGLGIVGEIQARVETFVDSLLYFYQFKMRHFLIFHLKPSCLQFKCLPSIPLLQVIGAQAAQLMSLKFSSTN
jgi:hypothetical protein